MLREKLELAAESTILREAGRVQVHDVLDARLASALCHCLEHATPWSLAIKTATESRTVESAQYSQMDICARRKVYDQAAKDYTEDEFAFAYDSYPMIRKYMEKADPGLLLHRVTEAMNGPMWLGMARELTGDERIRRSDCQATCYRPGQFLTHHDDDEPETGRLYAYVLSLTRAWRADWGGLLQFLDDRLRVCETFHPEFNCLTVFRVPQRHCVSVVAPFAQAPRLSITGWFLK